MNYEELYQNLIPLERKARDKITAAVSTFRNVCRASREGDLKAYAKHMQALEANIQEQTALLADLKTRAEAFDTRAYMESGDFAGQLEFELKELSVDVKGSYPVYEVFPFKLRMDADGGDVTVDRKKMPGVRPLALAERIKKDKDRLYRAGFNAEVFISELCAAYDRAVAVKNRGNDRAPEDGDIYLKDLYEYLVPVHRMRREYDAQTYAFDLSRLVISKAAYAKDGRKLSFGTSRKGGKMIRVLDENGNENFLTTVRFYKEGAVR